MPGRDERFEANAQAGHRQPCGRVQFFFLPSPFTLS